MPEKKKRTIEAEEIRIVDRHGRPRIAMNAVGDTCGIIFYNREGKRVLSLVSGESDGIHQTDIAVGGRGQHIIIHSDEKLAHIAVGNEKRHVSMVSQDNVCGCGIYHESGFVSTFGVEKDGRRVLDLCADQKTKKANLSFHPDWKNAFLELADGKHSVVVSP